MKSYVNYSFQDKTKGEPKGATEKTKTDKKHDRREKKKKQSEKAKQREKKEKAIEKLAPGLGNKYAKQKALKELERQSKSSKGITVLKVSQCALLVFK